MTIAADSGGFENDFKTVISSLVIFSNALAAWSNNGNTLKFEIFKQILYDFDYVKWR